MNSAGERVKYYRELIKKNEQAWINAKRQKDKRILSAQIETFTRLRQRYSTICNKEILQTNQLKLF